MKRNNICTAWTFDEVVEAMKREALEDGVGMKNGVVFERCMLVESDSPQAIPGDRDFVILYPDGRYDIRSECSLEEKLCLEIGSTRWVKEEGEWYYVTQNKNAVGDSLGDSL